MLGWILKKKLKRTKRVIIYKKTQNLRLSNLNRWRKWIYTLHSITIKAYNVIDRLKTVKIQVCYAEVKNIRERYIKLHFVIYLKI